MRRPTALLFRKDVTEMALTKKKKRILCVALPAAAVIVIAAGAVLWLVLGQTEPEQPFDLRRDQNTNEITYCAVKGRVDEQTAANLELPCYEIKLSQDWTQTENAMEGYVSPSLPRSYVNMSYDWYTDRYESEDGTQLTFGQRPAGEQLLTAPDAADNYSYTGELDPEDIQEVWFGDRQMIYYQHPDSLWREEDWDTVEITRTGIYWVYEQSLLHLSCTKAMDINQMLELAAQVDYQTQREPIPESEPPTAPLSLVRGGVTVTNTADSHTMYSHNDYCSQGNPEVPDSPRLPVFTAPENYALEGGWEDPSGIAIQQKYLGSDGEIISYSCRTGPVRFFQRDNGSGQIYLPFEEMSWEELEDPNSVQDATVKGNPAFVHINEKISEIGWIDGYCSLEIRCTAPMTAEELIALAESVE